LSFIVLLPLVAYVNAWGAPFAYITNYGDNNVSVIDAATNTVVGAPIPVGTGPYGVAVNLAATRVYVTNYGSNNVSVIDTETNTVIGAPIAVGTKPVGVAVNFAGTRLYVANFGSNTVAVIDTETNTVIGGPIAVGTQPQAFGHFMRPTVFVTVWTGGISFPLKLTVPVQDASGNTKFKTSTEAFAGTFKLHTGGDSLQPDDDGCYTLLASNDGKTSVCFKQVAFIATEVSKGKTDQLLLIGTGDMFKTMNAIPYEGNCYLDSKGTLKKDSSGKVTSISLSGKIGGGSNGSYLSGGSFKTTLTSE